MQLQALLFDLDGTLVDTIPMCIAAYKQTLETLLHREVAEEEITSYFGLTEKGILQKLAPEQWEDGFQRYLHHYERLHEEYREPFTGIKEALELLKAHGVRMAVVTGKGEETAHYTLKYLGIAPYFDRIQAGSASANIKSASIRQILADWQIDPQKAAYIGDADTDILEAHAAGTHALAATWSASSTIGRLTSLEPAATFPTVTSFTDWLTAQFEPHS